MTDNDIKTICEKIDSLHAKILSSKFAETVTESEILSLIFAVKELNRQKAEIERLKKENTVLWENNHILATEYAEEYAVKVKSEAIKEFAEKAKAKGIPVTGGRGFEGVTSMTTNIQLDNLVKEMTGENHD